nr:hypothetical protein [Tanacetum cinerariifolium]
GGGESRGNGGDGICGNGDDNGEIGDGGGVATKDTAGGDQGVAGSTPQAIGTVHTGTGYTEVMSNSSDYSSRTHSNLRGRQSPSTAR